MKKFLSKMRCFLLGHRFGPAKESDTLRIPVEVFHIGGYSTKKDIPGFTRERYCEKCGEADLAIVFTASSSPKNLQESDHEYWN